MDQEKEEQGFRRIGNLIPKTEALRAPKNLMTDKSTGSESVSATTGLQDLVPAGLSSIGKQRGGITFAVTSLGSKLAGLHPVVVDRAIKERLPPCAVSLISTAEILNRDYEVVGYKPLDLSPSEALAILESTDEFFIPAPHETILKGLARARAMTKRRAEQADDEEITLAAYAELFAPWPADVTSIVLSRLHKLEGGWWPSAAVVERELESFGRGRMEMRRALIAVRSPLEGPTKGARIAPR